MLKQSGYNLLTRATRKRLNKAESQVVKNNNTYCRNYTMSCICFKISPQINCGGRVDETKKTNCSLLKVFDGHMGIH